jgi:curved DNA-binding protein CbpA
MNIDKARQLLEVRPEARDEEIRAAYVRKVKEYPPDRSPQEFEQVREAYEALRDTRRQAQNILGSVPNQPLTSVLGGRQSERRFTGPAPWLAVLTEKKA